MSEIVKFKAQIVNLEKINPLIESFKVFIAYADEPANKFIFSREVLNGLIPTIKGAPINTFYSKEDDMFFGHEGDNVRTKRGMKRTPKPVAIGFCDYVSEPTWEKKTFDGIERDYLTCIAYLWTGTNKELQNLEDKEIWQSMEVKIDLDKKDGFFIVKDAILTGLTLIGVSPAFKGSTFEKFDFSAQNDDLSKDFEGMKAELDTYFSSKNITNFPNVGDNKSVTLSNSKYPTFDIDYAKSIKETYPDIWKKGGNIKGNSAFEVFSSDEVSIDWIKKREDWCDKHNKETRFSSIIESVKWSSVISKGEDFMKSAIEKEKLKFTAKEGETQVFHDLSMRQLESRIELSLSKFRYTDREWDYRKYHICDIKNSLVIVRDCQEEKTYSIPYIIDFEKNCVLNIDEKVEVEIDYTPVGMSLQEAFISKEEVGTEDKLATDLTKKFASKDEWGSVNKTQLSNEIAKKSNWKKLRDECFLVVEGDGENLTDWKFSVCQIKDDKLVYNVNGVQTAWTILQQEQEKSYFSEAKTKVEKIYKKLGLKTETFAERSCDVEKIKQMYADLKMSKGTCAYASDETCTYVLDMETKCAYTANDEGFKKIPFSDETEEFVLDEEKAEDTDFKEVMKCMSKIMDIDKAKLSESEVEVGKAFASITSLEADLLSNKAVMEERDAKVKELEAKLSEIEKQEKFKQAEVVIDSKEFSVFTREEKDELLKFSADLSLEDFENKLWAEFGKKVKSGASFDTNSTKFSFMNIGNPKKDEGQKEESIYEKIKRERNLNQK